MQDDDVVRRTARQPQDAVVGDREEVAQHPDDRGDAGPGGDEEQLATVGRQHELAGGLLEVDQRARLRLAHQVGADQAVGHGLDGDRDQAVAARTVGQGVGAPLADAVDVDADAEVLARHVAGPVGARLDHQRRGVLGLRGHRDDPAAQVGARPQRGEEVEEVGRHERVGRHLGQPADVRAQTPGSPRCAAV